MSGVTVLGRINADKPREEITRCGYTQAQLCRDKMLINVPVYAEALDETVISKGGGGGEGNKSESHLGDFFK